VKLTRIQPHRCLEVKNAVTNSIHNRQPSSNISFGEVTHLKRINWPHKPLGGTGINKVKRKKGSSPAERRRGTRLEMWGKNLEEQRLGSFENLLQRPQKHYNL